MSILGFIASTVISVVSGNGTGWSTQQEADNLEAALKASGHKEGCQDGYNNGQWERHLSSMNQDQPQEWNIDYSKDRTGE